MKSKGFKIVALFLAIVIVLSLMGIVVFKLPAVKYNHALNLIKKGEYYRAYNILYPLGDYKDNLELMKKFTHHYAVETTINSKGEVTTKQFSYYENGNLKEEIYTNVQGQEESKTYYENGNLKSESYYLFDNAQGDNKIVLNNPKYEYSYDYNSKGQLIKKTLVDVNSSGERYTTVTLYEYDKEGKLIREIDEKLPGFFNEYIYDENGNFLKYVNSVGEVSCEYTYDDKENLIQEKHYVIFGDEDYSQYDYVYDEKGNLIKFVEKGLFAENNSVREGVYDAEGNLIKVISYTEGNEEKNIVEIEYDSNGNIIKTSNNIISNNDTYTVRKLMQYRYGVSELFEYESDIWFITIPSSTTEYTYDEKGREIKRVTIDSDDNREITKSNYNADGQLVKVVVTNNEKVERIRVLKYDVYGNLIENILTDNNGKLIEKKEYTNFVGVYKKD